MIFPSACRTGLLAIGLLSAIPRVSCAQEPFRFPTANHFLYEPGSELKFFAPTAPDKPWTSGSFGCVRNNGARLHEGLDIRHLQTDRHGEPTDPVMATADGTVVYFSTKPALSNYGNYLVLRHLVEGIEIYSLYAHLERHPARPENRRRRQSRRRHCHDGTDFQRGNDLKGARPCPF